MADYRLLGCGAIGIVFAATALVPGFASAAPGDDAGQVMLKMTVTELQNSRTFTLNCDPVGGNHPQASVACDELQRVDGQFGRLDPRHPKSCIGESWQVSPSEEGAWRGQPVGYQVLLANPFKLESSTGLVFDFWAHEPPDAARPTPPGRT
ncbi:SSI family serine proteinase inhibitor [Saccharopolyspora shandongensis]|uniref:SSI family serine proteinase inhibitor n=1 Tax=Saccharopolyspora shandongensis TaxID=418495 RepID=UPI00341015B7